MRPFIFTFLLCLLPKLTPINAHCSKVEFWFKYLGLDSKACQYKKNNLIDKLKPLKDELPIKDSNANVFHPFGYYPFSLPKPFQYANTAGNLIYAPSGYYPHHFPSPIGAASEPAVVSGIDPGARPGLNSDSESVSGSVKDNELSESREARIDKVLEVVSNFLGDVVGVIISETIRKFGDEVSDLARYLVSRSSSFLLRKSGTYFANALQVLRMSMRSYDSFYYG